MGKAKLKLEKEEVGIKMVIVNYRKVKCDECGKEEEIKDGGTRPSNWFEVSITEWFGSTGSVRFCKEVCTEKCALDLIRKLKKIPKREPVHIY